MQPDSPREKLAPAAPSDALRQVEAALRSAKEGCQCSLRERESGHRVECYVPEVYAALDQLHAMAQQLQEGERLRAQLPPLSERLDRCVPLLEQQAAELTRTREALAVAEGIIDGIEFSISDGRKIPEWLQERMADARPALARIAALKRAPAGTKGEAE